MAPIASTRVSSITGLILGLSLSASSVSAAEHSPKSRAAHKPVVRASWYGTSFKGKPTANGAIFNPRLFTAAHRTIELGSLVKVTELRSGRSVVVEITDRGPFFPGRDLDLSYAAAHALGIVRIGVARVRVELVENEELLPATLLSPTVLLTDQAAAPACCGRGASNSAPAAALTSVIPPGSLEEFLISAGTKASDAPLQTCGLI